MNEAVNPDATKYNKGFYFRGIEAWRNAPPGGSLDGIPGFMPSGAPMSARVVYG